MKDRARAMIMASFAADSLALGAHWIYSTGKISRDFGRIETFLTPGADSYHPTKKQGEFTHYGDQAVVLLESLAHKGRFEPEDFSQRWRQFFRDYTGYFDQATKDTLKNISLGTDPLQAGSSSNDISGAARIAPVIYCLRNDGVELIKAVRTQTALTHTDPLTIDASEFFARVVLRTLEGNGVMPSIEEVSRTYPEGSLIRLLVKKGMDSCGEESVQAVKSFGQDCHAPDALPAVIHLVCRYEKDLKEALIQNVMAGGDSAARGMASGMILGAHLGMDSLPPEWMDGMKKANEINNLLDRIDEKRGTTLPAHH